MKEAAADTRYTIRPYRGAASSDHYIGGHTTEKGNMWKEPFRSYHFSGPHCISLNSNCFKLLLIDIPVTTSIPSCNQIIQWVFLLLIISIAGLLHIILHYLIELVLLSTSVSIILELFQFYFSICF